MHLVGQDRKVEKCGLKASVVWMVSGPEVDSASPKARAKANVTVKFGDHQK